MDLAQLTTKYTGQPVDSAALQAAHRHGGFAADLAAALTRVAYALDSTELELRRLATTVTNAALTVTRNVCAEPDERVPTLNPFGELGNSGPRLDALVAVRAAQIDHLTVLVHLWRHAPTSDSDPAVP